MTATLLSQPGPRSNLRLNFSLLFARGRIAVTRFQKKSPVATKPLTPRLDKNPSTCQLH
jgi:hypothetical protein